MRNSISHNGLSAISFFLSVLLVAQTGFGNTQVCGNSVVEATEQCDLGQQNGVAGSGCSSTCQVVAICGNNVAESSAAGTEQCDDTFLPNTTCTNGCKLVIPTKCGNGVVDPGEDCEPSISPTFCNLDCTSARCGDGKLSPNSGEQCDGHRQTATCNLNCQYSVCGDQIVNSASGEQCDAGTQTANCNWNCKFSLCGDGILNQLSGEECDDGVNNTASGPCLPNCKILVTTTTTAATNQSNTQSPTSSGGSSDTLNYVGVIAGTVIGVLALAAAIIPVAWQCKKHYNKKRARNAAATTSQTAIPLNQVGPGKPNPFAQQTPSAQQAPTAYPPVVPPLITGGVGPSKPAKPLPQAPVTPPGSNTPTTPKGTGQAGSTTSNGKTII